MEIVWAEEAYLAWQEAMDYIIQHWGIQSGIDFYSNTEDWQETLSSSPYIGKVEPLLLNRSRVYRSLTISKHNKMVYYVEADIITIVDFWDTRREPKRQAQSLS